MRPFNRKCIDLVSSIFMGRRDTDGRSPDYIGFSYCMTMLRIHIQRDGNYCWNIYAKRHICTAEWKSGRAHPIQKNIYNMKHSSLTFSSIYCCCCMAPLWLDISPKPCFLRPLNGIRKMLFRPNLFSILCMILLFSIPAATCSFHSHSVLLQAMPLSYKKYSIVLASGSTS